MSHLRTFDRARKVDHHSAGASSQHPHQGVHPRRRLPEYLTSDEDAQLTALPALAKVRLQRGMMSAAPAGMVAGAALQHFLGLDDAPLEHPPSAEEWHLVCSTLLERLSPQDVAAEESKGFQTFCDSSSALVGSLRAQHPQALARYLTLYLPADHCLLHEYWPRQNVQEVVDRTVHEAAMQYLDKEPLPDCALVDRIRQAIQRIGTRL